MTKTTTPALELNCVIKFRYSIGQAPCTAAYKSAHVAYRSARMALDDARDADCGNFHRLCARVDETLDALTELQEAGHIAASVVID